MPLSKNATEELRAELRRLESQTAAIRAILGDEPSGPGHTSKAGEADSAQRGLGVRAFLNRALDESPVGLTTREAVHRVSELGYRVTGKTPLKTMVSSELYRLKRLGKVTRGPGKKFRRVTEERAAS